MHVVTYTCIKHLPSRTPNTEKTKLLTCATRPIWEAPQEQVCSSCSLKNSSDCGSQPPDASSVCVCGGVSERERCKEGEMKVVIVLFGRE